VPNRFEFGCGLSPEIGRGAKKGAAVLVTVDMHLQYRWCVSRQKFYGMKVVVTDHAFYR